MRCEQIKAQLNEFSRHSTASNLHTKIKKHRGFKFLTGIMLSSFHSLDLLVQLISLVQNSILFHNKLWIHANPRQNLINQAKNFMNPCDPRNYLIHELTNSRTNATHVTPRTRATLAIQQTHIRRGPNWASCSKLTTHTILY